MSATWSNWSYMVLGVPIRRCRTASSRTIHRLGGSGRSKMLCRANRAATSWSIASSLGFSNPSRNSPGVVDGLEQAGDEEGLPDPQRMPRSSRSRREVILANQAAPLCVGHAV